MDIITDASEEILTTYNLVLVGPAELLGLDVVVPEPVLRETEENLTDLLPEGYRVIIKEWSDE